MSERHSLIVINISAERQHFNYLCLLSNKHLDLFLFYTVRGRRKLPQTTNKTSAPIIC